MSDDFSEEEVARYWDANAGPWAAEVRRGADGAREWLNNPAFLPFLGDLNGRQVLDAGCGEGYNTRILARASEPARLARPRCALPALPRREAGVYSRGAIRSTACAEVTTGITSKSVTSLQRVIHCSRRPRSSHSIT
jgi:hypothetical protein